MIKLTTTVTLTELDDYDKTKFIEGLYDLVISLELKDTHIKIEVDEE